MKRKLRVTSDARPTFELLEAEARRERNADLIPARGTAYSSRPWLWDICTMHISSLKWLSLPLRVNLHALLPSRSSSNSHRPHLDARLFLARTGRDPDIL